MVLWHFSSGTLVLWWRHFGSSAQMEADYQQWSKPSLWIDQINDRPLVSSSVLSSLYFFFFLLLCNVYFSFGTIRHNEVAAGDRGRYHWYNRQKVWRLGISQCRCKSKIFLKCNLCASVCGGSFGFGEKKIVKGVMLDLIPLRATFNPTIWGPFIQNNSK